MKRVKVNAWYKYQPVPFDQINKPCGIIDGTIKIGDTVKVVNRFGCPKANTMGMCYIESESGIFAGMVCTNSLIK